MKIDKKLKIAFFHMDFINFLLPGLKKTVSSIKFEKNGKRSFPW